MLAPINPYFDWPREWAEQDAQRLVGIRRDIENAERIVVARTLEESPRYDIKSEDGAILRDVTPDNIFSVEAGTS